MTHPTRTFFYARPARIVRGFMTFAAIAIGLGLASCSVLRSAPTAELAAISTQVDDGRPIRTLAPAIITTAYRPIDENTADIYLSDLPVEQFESGSASWRGVSGSIVHIHVFLYPSAGNTPIDSTSCNVTIRHLVLASTGASEAPAIGLYAGAGFLFPRGDIDDATFGGSIDRASHRLARSTSNFQDLLGTGTISGSLSAQLDERLARSMNLAMDTLLRRLPPVERHEEPKPQADPAPTPKDTKPAADSKSDAERK